MSDDDSNGTIPVPSGAEGPAAPASMGPHQSATLMGEGPWDSLPDGSTRHDGWTGPLKAKFCETLAETGIVVDACLAAGKGRASAYALRHRDPLFAAAWEAALGQARAQLSDALLARSIEGSVESFYRDGALVGEKRYFDNRLGLAVLKRLDRVAETGSPLSLPGQSSSVRPEPSRRTALTATPAPDWDQMIGALRTGEPGAVAIALAALKVGEAAETDKTDNPPDSSFSAEQDSPEDEELEGPDRVWQSHEDWWTDFPPPAGFNGVEHGIWGARNYKRVCSDSEIAVLEAAQTLDQAGGRAAQDCEREAFFAGLAAEVAEELEISIGVTPAPEPGPAFPCERQADPGSSPA